MSADLPVVFRAASIEEAEIVAIWLEERGVATFVKDEHAAVVMQTPLIVAPRGIAVCVAPESETVAKALLDEHREELQRRKTTGEGRVDARCEECGRVTSFPAAARGTVQTCPNCRANMDVGADASGGEPEPIS